MAYGEESSEGLFPFGITDEEQNIVTTSRSPRPISKIAENVTVITSEDIARLNAHSLTEILQAVPGIHVHNTRTPGDFTFLSIQGQSDVYGTLVLLVDGINQTTLNQGYLDPGTITAQQIERVEIIKGAASAAWGPALGGVINVITKSPEPDRSLSGAVSASYGEKNTSHLASEISGTKNGIGYYLTGGNLHSMGLFPNNGVNRNNLYGKLTYELPSKGNLTGGISYVEIKRGFLEVYDLDFDYIEHDDNKTRRYHSFLNFSYPIKSDLTLDVTGHDGKLNNETMFGSVEPTTGLVAYSADGIYEERNSGAKARLTWGDTSQNLTTGIEYLHSFIKIYDRLDPTGVQVIDRRRDSLSLYANGTYTLGKLSLLPGVRYDKTGLNENTTNYTIGATYQLNEKTLLRSYWAKGYGMPNALLKSVPARIRTFQAGIESEAVPYLWLKGTFFYNHIWHIQDYFANQDIFYTHNYQGFELEARSVPVNGISLRGSYTFTDAEDKDIGQRIKGVPVHIAKLALSYLNNSIGTDLLLSGNYAWLNMDYWGDADQTWSHRPHYTPIIWNLHLTQKLSPENDLSPELFLNLNNIFNGSQYWDYWYKNTPRWIEGGVRFRF